ncbi:hypothetical protein BN1723_014144 [Verticillium longisporum]|uniref:beta-glucosidase n=1 Tax=Verticillium longisporum TaxID=100787 RepID=A0A0G4M400_VERLO|nr:hypothetical protein BN1723_014144 [Verticillium longisporum]
MEGIQENGVITSTKHFIAQEQETHRLSTRDDGPFQEAISSNGGVVSALSGLDVAMPNGAGKFGSSLVEAVSNGSLPEAQIDNMDTEDFPKPGNGMAQRLWEPHPIVDARTKCSRPTLFDGAVEGHVLVKNEENALPLRSENMKLISLFGYSTRAPSSNTPVPAANGTRFASWEMGIQSANITEVDLGWFGNLDLPTSDIAINGTVISAGGSAAPSWSLISAPCDALVAQAYEDGTALYHDFESGDPSINPNSDVCIVIGNVWATEGYDRPSLRDQYTDMLILNVANKCANTIVVFHNAGPRLVDSFIEHPNSDYGDLLKPDYTSRGVPSRFPTYPQSNFAEGAFVDYRGFDSKKVDLRFEFGFGLSYTSFDYSSLKISKANGNFVVVEADVTNNGKVDGKEVAQLYLGIPGDEYTPLKQLRGFEKQLIKAADH